MNTFITTLVAAALTLSGPVVRAQHPGGVSRPGGVGLPGDCDPYGYTYLPPDFVPSGLAVPNTPVNRAFWIAQAVQEALYKKGYYLGEVDGIIGPATVDAIRRYQSFNELAETGVIDGALLHSLGIK